MKPLQTETPRTVAEKNFVNLQALTPGSEYIHQLDPMHLFTIHKVHGYSLLRTQLSNEYYHDLFDESLKFGIEVEGHRKSALRIRSYPVIIILLKSAGFRRIHVQIPRLDLVYTRLHLHIPPHFGWQITLSYSNI